MQQGSLRALKMEWRSLWARSHCIPPASVTESVNKIRKTFILFAISLKQRNNRETGHFQSTARHMPLVQYHRKCSPPQTPVLGLGSFLENTISMKDLCQKNRIMQTAFSTSASLVKLAGWVNHQLPAVCTEMILTCFPHMSSEISLQSARQPSSCWSCLFKHVATILVAALGLACPRAPELWHSWWRSRVDLRSRMGDGPAEADSLWMQLSSF